MKHKWFVILRISVRASTDPTVWMLTERSNVCVRKTDTKKATKGL